MKITDETIDENLADMRELTAVINAFADKWEMGAAVIKVESYDIRKWNTIHETIDKFVDAVGKVVKLPPREHIKP